MVLKIDDARQYENISFAEFTIKNNNEWDSHKPILKMGTTALNGWKLQVTLDGKDVTAPICSDKGLRFVNTLEIHPSTSKELKVTLSSNKKGNTPKPTVKLSLIGHPNTNFYRQIWTFN